MSMTMINVITLIEQNVANPNELKSKITALVITIFDPIVINYYDTHCRRVTYKGLLHSKRYNNKYVAIKVYADYNECLYELEFYSILYELQGVSLPHCLYDYVLDLSENNDDIIIETWSGDLTNVDYQ